MRILIIIISTLFLCSCNFNEKKNNKSILGAWCFVIHSVDLKQKRYCEIYFDSINYMTYYKGIEWLDPMTYKLQDDSIHLTLHDSTILSGKVELLNGLVLFDTIIDTLYKIDYPGFTGYMTTLEIAQDSTFRAFFEKRRKGHLINNGYMTLTQYENELLREAKIRDSIYESLRN